MRWGALAEGRGVLERRDGGSWPEADGGLEFSGVGKHSDLEHRSRWWWSRGPAGACQGARQKHWPTSQTPRWPGQSPLCFRPLLTGSGPVPTSPGPLQSCNRPSQASICRSCRHGSLTYSYISGLPLPCAARLPAGCRQLPQLAVAEAGEHPPADCTVRPSLTTYS